MKSFTSAENLREKIIGLKNFSYKRLLNFYKTLEQIVCEDEEGGYIGGEGKKKLLASFNNHEEACNMLCGKGRVRTQDLGYQSRAL